MNVYVRCSKCHFKQKGDANSMSGTPCCPECKSNTIDMQLGRVPEWWTAGDEKRHKVKELNQ